MKEQHEQRDQRICTALKIGGTVALLALGSTAWAANDLDVVSKATRGRTIDAHNMELVGWNDNQGRLAYHMVIQNQLTADGQRVIAYVGNFSGKNLNPLTGNI